MEFNLTVTEQEIQIISMGLSELPFKHVSGLIAKLQGQIDRQVNPQIKQGDSNEKDNTDSDSNTSDSKYGGGFRS